MLKFTGSSDEEEEQEEQAKDKISEIYQEINDILKGICPFWLEILEIEPEIRKNIQEHPELPYFHFKSWQANFPKYDRSFLLTQAVMLAALIQGSEKIKDGIKRIWTVRRFCYYIEDPEPDDILAWYAFKIMEKENCEEELSLILGHHWKNINTQLFLFKFIAQSIHKIIINLLENEIRQNGVIHEEPDTRVVS